MLIAAISTGTMWAECLGLPHLPQVTGSCSVAHGGMATCALFPKLFACRALVLFRWLPAVVMFTWHAPKKYGVFLNLPKKISSSVFLHCYTSGVHDIVMLLGDVLHVSGVHPLISGR